MPKLIERDALKNHLYQAQAEAFKRSEWYVAGSIQSFIDILDNQPTIEPEVRHGRWISYGSNTAYTKYYRCSLCGYEIAGYAESNDLIKYNYCPNCGADMREAIEDADDN